MNSPSSNGFMKEKNMNICMGKNRKKRNGRTGVGSRERERERILYLYTATSKQVLRRSG